MLARLACILLASSRMSLRRAAFALPTFLLAITLSPTRVYAQASVPHLRPDTQGLRALTARAAERSPIVRALIDQLDQSSVIVYLRHRVFGPVTVDGHIGLLSASATHRFLVIELACDRSELTQMATLGHELYHALEIAGESSVVDTPTLMRFYTHVGSALQPMGVTMTFETQAAADTGARVRHELLASPTRSAHGY
jgi:hypothetical protein